MSQPSFEQAIEKIDKENAKDPNKEVYQGKEYPKELLYAQRMTKALLDFNPQANEELQIAARAQHIARWKIDRSSYPMDRVGYLKWREELKKMHADMTSEILSEVGYNVEFIERVSFLIRKKMLKKDPDSQTLEDVVCLVFLHYYFEDFAQKHPDEKVVDILQKTWGKMSEKGHKAALELPLDEKSFSLIKKALA
ncbi:DUF4202 domain-containing protein [Galbibacter pacificus]|uniref:DUF4202 domain-containing protein n=1 Tax=Galbibacter pacificus TaxID=2996052 RepID=A0ABT6FUU8_9FLAO|nr:DUF4202 domain-containing protein [Galbibacter pacificus]MDG3583478.1 DUF4202 domain-containing protein [Galbibacter pacificus]MDG3587045.1 DUF4202 domain-containing protein [Galbibacter pacificus]